MFGLSSMISNIMRNVNQIVSQIVGQIHINPGAIPPHLINQATTNYNAIVQGLPPEIRNRFPNL